jgi:U2-associated protein SR140
MTERTYRDEVNSILTVWKDEHLFDKPALEHLDSAFNAQEREKEEAEQERKLVEKRNKRKAAAKTTANTKVDIDDDGENSKMDIDQEEGGEMGALDAANDATPQAVSTTVASAEPDVMMAETAANDNVPPTAPEIAGETAAARARRLRPRAEDMFASDGE